MRTLIALLSLTLAVPAFAADAQLDRAKAELKESKGDRKDAKKDLKQLQKLIKKWTKAADKRDWEKANKHDPDIFAWLREERKETRGELQETRKEAQGSRRQADRARGAAEGAAERALADDRRDVRTEETRRDRLARIHEQLEEIQPSFRSGRPGPENAKKKRELLTKLSQLAVRDLKQAEAEFEEDKAAKDAAKR